MRITAKSRQWLAAATCVLALASANSLLRAGTPIEFSDPDSAIAPAQQKKDDNQKRSTFTLNAAPAQELGIPDYASQPRVFARKKDSDKEKDNDWTSPGSSFQTASASKTDSSSPLTRAWNKNIAPGLDPFGMDSLDVNSSKGDKSKNTATGGLETRMGDVSERRATAWTPYTGYSLNDFSGAAQSHTDELKRQTDRQTHLTEFNSLYGPPASSSTAAKSVHDALWQHSRDGSGFSDLTPRTSRDSLPPSSSTSTSASQASSWNTPSQSSGAYNSFSQRSRYNDDSSTSSGRNVNPTSSAIPKAPGSIF